jgi:hypothetical protein
MKIIHHNMLQKHKVTSRFIEEAQIGAQLQHPNIVPILGGWGKFSNVSYP